MHDSNAPILPIQDAVLHYCQTRKHPLRFFFFFNEYNAKHVNYNITQQMDKNSITNV